MSVATGQITRSEIASQPAMWAQAVQLAAGNASMPAPWDRVLFLGCGTSFYVGEVYRRARNATGAASTRTAVPSELDAVDDDEVVIALSRSGTTGDVADVLRQISGQPGRRTIGIVGTPETIIGQLCSEVIDLSFADERSIVQTRFATTAMTLLRASLDPDLNLTADALSALHRPVPTPLPRHVVFLGTGISLGMAHEAALKCLESSGAWVEAYAMREYQHGPIAAADEDTLVWPLVPAPEDLVRAVRDTGARIVEPSLDPQAELVAAHHLAVALADAAGRDPDVPLHLSRSVF